MTTVAGTIGREKGSAASRRLRREGKIPCVVYGLDQTPESISVDYGELRDALQGKAGLNTVFTPLSCMCRLRHFAVSFICLARCPSINISALSAAALAAPASCARVSSLVSSR